MKNFLDHFPYLFLVHRPRPEMFNKKAFILCTTAGAGLKPAMRTVYGCLKYWGINRIYRLGFRILALNWDDMPEKRKQNYERKIQKAAARFWRSIQKGGSPATPFCRGMFQLCKKMHQSGNDLPADHRYWEQHGWLKGQKPY